MTYQIRWICDQKTMQSQGWGLSMIGPFCGVSYLCLLIDTQRTCAIHSENFTTVFQRTWGAAQDEDVYQEDGALFGFFVKGLSALESFYFSLYALGALIRLISNVRDARGKIAILLIRL
jgi:hypothetical protein